MMAYQISANILSEASDYRFDREMIFIIDRIMLLIMNIIQSHPIQR